MFSRRTFLALPAGSAAAARDVPLNDSAESYVKLVLAVGRHDPDYVDAYYGPPEWKEAAGRQIRPLAEIRKEASALLAQLSSQIPVSADEMLRLRHRYLTVQTRSLAKRVEMLEGRRLRFDEESRALYDAVAPSLPESRFEAALAAVERLLPGSGTPAGRYEAWRKQFYIPANRLDRVFRATVDEARARTRLHIRLPEAESFVIEYVKGQVWSAYNWYRGNAHSLIQVNTDLPVDAAAALHLAAHEGYPGHHVYNALLEDRLVKGRGWLEYSVYPLYSPQSLIAEGSAEYGAELAFPPAERAAYFRETLFPLAGLDRGKAGEYQEVQQHLRDLDNAVNQAARGLVDGRITKEQCQAYLARYALASPERAAQRVRFIEKNRAYVINYNLGQDLIRAYLEKRGAVASNSSLAWREFERLLSSPRLPSGLA